MSVTGPASAADPDNRRAVTAPKRILSRPACNIGVGCKGSVTYWRNLKLLDVAESDKPVAPEVKEPEVF